jgi:hypothetical protein
MNPALEPQDAAAVASVAREALAGAPAAPR